MATSFLCKTGLPSFSINKAAWSLLGLSIAFLFAPQLLASELDCTGTLLQLQVQESGATSSDRFRFSLGLQAEASTKSAALALLTQYLDQVREDLKPFALGSLQIAPPRSYAYRGDASYPSMERASTSVAGEVSGSRYERLIQLAGRLPGVRLQSMTSLSSKSSSVSLEDQLLKQALKQGSRRANGTANALGLRRVDLLRINQRDSGVRPFAYEARMSKPSFRPDEVAKPTRLLTLGLDYCLH